MIILDYIDRLGRRGPERGGGLAIIKLSFLLLNLQKYCPTFFTMKNCEQGFNIMKIQLSSQHKVQISLRPRPEGQDFHDMLRGSIGWAMGSDYS